MELKVTHGVIEELETDAIIVGIFKDEQPAGAAKHVDAALNGAISDLIEGGDLSGKDEDVAVLYPRGAIPARRVIVVGLGKKEGWDANRARNATYSAVEKARQVKASTAAVALYDQREVEAMAQAVTEGALLATYDYRGQKTDEASERRPETLELVVPEERNVPLAEQGVTAGEAIFAGVTLTRDLVNLPPNICTPEYMAQAARKAAEEVGLRLEVLEKRQMESLGMGALLGVAQGSDTPPRFIIMEHNADRAEELDTIVLAGKGVTFDTGGYNLKTGEGIGHMKTDMAGAAAVIGAMRAIGALDVPLHVVGLVPAADNMISGHAYRPQEVITASNGTSIEVINTDAEGRLLLADALSFAARYNPAAVVDIATLTGACVVALGKVAAGLFSTDDDLRDRLLAAGDATDERLWALPLFPEYEKTLKSDTADVKNTGGRGSGVGSSATFLKHFVSYPAWAHIDMAGMAFKQSPKDAPYVPGGKGATGFGVRLLTAFVRSWA
ncbi:MAG: leucyl aminopeptidase [Anaerolineae bacterium]